MLRLHEYLRGNIQKELNNQNVRLDAFIISVTPYNTVVRMHPEQSIALEEFERDNHVLFQFKDKEIPNTSYVERLFKIALHDQIALAN